MKYVVKCKTKKDGETHVIIVEAANKAEAWQDAIHKTVNGRRIVSAWVAARISKDGKKYLFDTSENKPY